MPQRGDLKKILILGSGPIVIGQACEFDYSGTQACKALRKAGYEIILINSNPASIMTDPEIASKTYIEPLTPEIVSQIILREKPDAILPTMGGQTALNLAVKLSESDFLKKNKGDWIFGEELTYADIYLFPTLIRWELIYSKLFKCTEHELSSFEKIIEWRLKFFKLPLSQLKDNSHWFPLLLPINSCHSSIIIDDNSLNRLLDSLLESKRDKDSGVVIRILGGLASCFFFSYEVVSPFLISTVISLLKCKAANCMEFFRSLLSAFKGVINNICTLLLFLGSSI